MIGLNCSEKWDKIVTSFQQYDVYYLSAYVKAFKIHGDGEPFLMTFETENLRGMYVAMKRDLYNFDPFCKSFEPGTYFDITTPYGYGGFLFEGDTSEKSMNEFFDMYKDFVKSERIVSSFVRYHPLILNVEPMRMVSEVYDIGKTISINLESKEQIWNNYSSRNRTQIRKSERIGTEIYHGKSLKLLETFRKIYNETMVLNQAEPYYFFEKEFYESIYYDLKDNFEIFYAVNNGQIIAISIMLFANKRMHCHLLGSIMEYRSYASTNYLLSEAAFWGNEQGFKTMHIGGGIGSEEDSLYRFKKAFNIHEENTFSIGKEIFDNEVYNSLVDLRREFHSEFNINSLFFPLYRAL